MRTTFKRRIPYQWRLFLPLVIVLWTMLLGLAGWQNYRAKKYERAFVEQQLKLINERVSRAWHNGDIKTLNIFKEFMRDFFKQEPLFDEIRLTIYDESWDVVDSLGQVIQLDGIERLHSDNEVFERPSETLSDSLEERRAYYLVTPTLRNGSPFYVVSSLPNDDILEQYIYGRSLDVWIVVFLVAMAVTIIAYITTKHLARNINLLSQFADRTANETGFIPGTDFAHDELGDIASKIVKIYNDRAVMRQEMEREHQLTIHTLEEKARQKRQLTNNINHELKTPIGVIKGYLDTILDSEDMDAETQRYFLSKARDHVNRLVNLVADVSAITRLEEGENRIGTEQLDFKELVYVFAHDASESGMIGHFNMEIAIPSGIYVVGNNNLLVGMLMNLTKNAVNYSGGNTLKVELLSEDDEFYTFSFSDDGTGVPETSLAHLFDRFYRIDSGRARKSGGTGLGLAIVFNTVKAHGGTITARNREKGGLEFVFTLRKWVH